MRSGHTDFGQRLHQLVISAVLCHMVFVQLAYRACAKWVSHAAFWVWDVRLTDVCACNAVSMHVHTSCLSDAVHSWHRA